MRKSDLYRPSSMVMALCLVSYMAVAPATAETIDDDRTATQTTTESDSRIIVTSDGSVDVTCDGTATQSAINVDDSNIDQNFLVRLDDGSLVQLSRVGDACDAQAASLRISDDRQGTITINGSLFAFPEGATPNEGATIALLIGDGEGFTQDVSTNLTVGETGQIVGDIHITGDSTGQFEASIDITNDGDITGDVTIEDYDVTLENNGTYAGQIAISETNGNDHNFVVVNNGSLSNGTNNSDADVLTFNFTGDSAITLNNIGTRDINGDILEDESGVIFGNITIVGDNVATQITNTGIIRGQLNVTSIDGTNFLNLSISNSGLINATDSPNALLLVDVGNENSGASLSNSFLGEIVGNLVFGDVGAHSISNSGDITGLISFGDGENRATFSAGVIQAADSAAFAGGPLVDMGSNDDSITLNGGIVQAIANVTDVNGDITQGVEELTDENGTRTGFTFHGAAEAGTLVQMGEGADTFTASSGALGGATTLLDMGGGDDTLNISLSDLTVLGLDPNGVITGGDLTETDGDTLTFNTAGVEDGFTFVDFGTFEGFENFSLLGGTLILDPDSTDRLQGMTGTLSISSGATLELLQVQSFEPNGFAAGEISGTLRLNTLASLTSQTEDSEFTIKNGGLIEFVFNDAGTDFGRLTDANAPSSTMTIESGGRIEAIIPRGSLDDQLTSFTSAPVTVTVVEANAFSLKDAVGDELALTEINNFVTDDNPFYDYTAEIVGEELNLTITRTPGLQAIINSNGASGILGSIGAALDAEFQQCTTGELDPNDSDETLCGFIASTADSDDGTILNNLALAAPDRISGEHTIRVNTQQSLHSLIEKRANVLRARSRDMPSGVGSGRIDSRQSSRLSAQDRQMAGLTDNLTNQFDGKGEGELLDLGSGMAAGSVWSAHNVWFQAYSAFTERDRTRQSGGYEADQIGFAMGYDWRASRTWLFGFYGGYALSNVDGSDSSREQIDIDTVSGGLFMSWFDRYTSWSTTMSVGITNMEGERIGLGGNKNTRDSDGYEFALSSNVDTNITIANRLILTPALDLNFGIFGRDGYTEDGAFGLTVDDKTSHSLATGISAKLAAPGQMGATGVLPYIRTGVWHEFLDDTSETTAKFANSQAGANFTVSELDTESTQYLAGLGIDVVSPRGGVNFTFGYNFIGGDDTMSHTLDTSLRFRF